MLARLRSSVHRRLLTRLRTALAQTPEVMADPESVVTMGRGSYTTPTVINFGWGDGETRVRVGNYSSISRGTRVLLGGNHHPEYVTTFPFNDRPQPEWLTERVWQTSRGDVSIGNDVWVGYDCTILSGVTIGDGAVIGTGSLVTRDVAPYEIVGGTPARHLRWRFPEEQRASLREIAWWDWPDEIVRGRMESLVNHDVAGFISAFDRSAQKRDHRSG